MKFVTGILLFFASQSVCFGNEGMFSADQKYFLSPVHSSRSEAKNICSSLNSEDSTYELAYVQNIEEGTIIRSHFSSNLSDLGIPHHILGTFLIHISGFGEIRAKVETETCSPVLWLAGRIGQCDTDFPSAILGTLCEKVSYLRTENAVCLGGESLGVFGALITTVTTEMDCMKRCTERPSCLGISFFRRGTNWCALRTDCIRRQKPQNTVSSVPQPFRIALQKEVVGIVSNPIFQFVQTQFNSTCPDEYLLENQNQIQENLESCSTACLRVPSSMPCRFFTYHDRNQLCSLYRKCTPTTNLAVGRSFIYQPSAMIQN